MRMHLILRPIYFLKIKRRTEQRCQHFRCSFSSVGACV